MKRIKILIAPDKFRPMLTAQKVCQLISSELPKNFIFKNIPLADGGQGSLETIQKSLKKCMKKTAQVHDPIFRRINSNYLLDKYNKTAYIEMAKASGLTLLNKSQQNPLKTSTFGTGQLINDALKEGCKNIYLMIGGSATNEGGIGAACALGYKFIGREGQQLIGIGQNLCKIETIISPTTNFRQIKMKVLTDVDNPLIGPKGASFIFGRQKGAKQQNLLQLEKGMIRLSQKIKQHLNIDVSMLPGGGAAGGLGAGCSAFFNAQILSGIKTISQIVNLQQEIKNTDIVVTGQGKVDQQSMRGKVIKGVIDLSKKYNKPVIIFCGKSQIRQRQLGYNFRILENQKIGMTDHYSIQNAQPLLRQSARQFFSK